MDYRVTQCPSCGTAFKVTDTQLAMAAGAVRCGSCLQIFRAAEHWVDPPPAPDTAEPPLTETEPAAPPSWASLQRREGEPAAATAWDEHPQTDEHEATTEAPAAIDELDLTDEDDDWLDEPIFWDDAQEPPPGDLRLDHDSPPSHVEPEFIPSDEIAAATEASGTPPLYSEPEHLPSAGEAALPGQPAANAYTDPANSDGWASPVAQLTRQRWDPVAQQIEDPFPGTPSPRTADEVLAERHPGGSVTPAGQAVGHAHVWPTQGLYDGFVLDAPLSASRDEALDLPEDTARQSSGDPGVHVKPAAAPAALEPGTLEPSALEPSALEPGAQEAGVREDEIAEDAAMAADLDDAELTFSDDPTLDGPGEELKGADAESLSCAPLRATPADAEAGADHRDEAPPEVDESWAEQLLEEAIGTESAQSTASADGSAESSVEPVIETSAHSPEPPEPPLPPPPESPHDERPIANVGATAAHQSSPPDTLHASCLSSATEAPPPDPAATEALTPAAPEAASHDVPGPAAVLSTPLILAPVAEALSGEGTAGGQPDTAAMQTSEGTHAGEETRAAEPFSAPETPVSDTASAVHDDASIEPVPAEDAHRLEAIVAGTAPVPTSGQRRDAFARTPLGDFEPEPIELQRLARRQRWPQIVWGTIAIAALLGLAAQYIHANIGTLGRGEYRPLVAQFCALTGCQLPALHNTRLIDTDHLVVRSHPEAPSALAVDAVLTNRAAFAQPYPDLLLQFSDLNGDAVAGRRFAPSDYLGGEVSGARLMPVRQPVRIVLEIADPGARAVNYQLQVVPFQRDPD